MEYSDKLPKQFGDIHERMKYLKELAREAQDKDAVSWRIWMAVCDLETEVENYKAIKPPFGKGFTRTKM